jgi:hypothetical protein
VEWAPRRRQATLLNTIMGVLAPSADCGAVDEVSTAFAPTQARRIRALRSRVLVGQPASSGVVASYTPPPAPVTQALVNAFLHQRVAAIRYEDQTETVTEREIETQSCLWLTCVTLRARRSSTRHTT